MTLPRLLAGLGSRPTLTLAEHEAAHGPTPARRRDLIAMTDQAGLRGRGGASFATAVKLRSVARRPGPRAVLVNAAEGEPMSFKDRVLLERAPHLVLDGALAAAAAVDATRIVIAVRRDAIAAGSAMQAAIEARALRGVELCAVPDAYLAGQESALIRHLDGGPLKPLVMPPRAFERGLRRRPTLVHNAETIAHLALIERHGPAWFRELGTVEHPGSTLVTVGGAVARPGVYEIACGTALPEVLRAAGETTEPLRAVLIGGFHGIWIGAERCASVRLSDDGLARHGGSVAAGVVIALGRCACPAREVAATVAWLAGQSAHQCGPCSNGLPALAQLLAAIVAGHAPADAFDRLARWTRDIAGRGACGLPDGAARFVSSAVRVFSEELAEHARRGPCVACGRAPTLLAAPSTNRAAA
jgi:NADH:ubiquinone oxidoreductase subunit F (NADH-binding)